jgi:hypothetical protein
MIVSWSDLELANGLVRLPGRGRVDAMLDDRFMLVKTIPRGSDDEPIHQVVLNIGDPGLLFFDSIDEEQAWYAWMISDDPKRVVALVQDDG